MTKPYLLIRVQDWTRGYDTIDYIEMRRIPNDFRKLRDTLTSNIEEFENYIETIESYEWASMETIMEYKQIIQNVKDLNEDYLKIKA